MAKQLVAIYLIIGLFVASAAVVCEMVAILRRNDNSAYQRVKFATYFAGVPLIILGWPAMAYWLAQFIYAMSRREGSSNG